MVANLSHFLCNMDIYMKKKKTLSGLQKNMQSKMRIKDHIDHVLTDAQLNNYYYNMVCGGIFFILHLRWPHSIQYAQKEL